MLRHTAQALAKAADVDEVTIRRRAAMFIKEGAGLTHLGHRWALDLKVSCALLTCS